MWDVILLCPKFNVGSAKALLKYGVGEELIPYYYADVIIYPNHDINCICDTYYEIIYDWYAIIKIYELILLSYISLNWQWLVRWKWANPEEYW